MAFQKWSGPSSLKIAKHRKPLLKVEKSGRSLAETHFEFFCFRVPKQRKLNNRERVFETKFVILSIKYYFEKKFLSKYLFFVQL